jgi:hypothetical protein
MTSRTASCCGIAAISLALLLVVAFIPQANAQSQEIVIPSTHQTIPLCKLADLDLNVGFFTAGTDFIVGFNLQNNSKSPCVPDLGVAYPMFIQEHGRQPESFGLCTDCEDRLPDGQYRMHDPVVLNPGEIGHQTYRWKTAAPAETIKCLRLSALMDPALVSAPTLFKPVCSEIAVSRIYLGEFAAEKDGALTDEAQSAERFVLSSRKPRYYKDEMFTLHVGLVDYLAASLMGDGCPTLLLRQRSADGFTRFDEVSPAGFKTCKSFTLGADRSADWQSGFEVQSGARSRWEGTGEHSFEIFQLVDSSDDGRPRFVRSNKLTVEIDDPALIQRKWQGQAKGVRADVTLDKNVYRQNEDVPLHIAIENFDAPVPIYATDPVWDPFTAIGIEVRDATGRLLPENERSSSNIWSTGHGFGPVLFPAGKVVAIERDLMTEGWLPNRPGVYTVVVTWCPIDGTNFKPVDGVSLKNDAKIYATVRAVETFRIVGEPPAASHSEP